LAAHPQVRHLKIADGKGRRLGRSFAVKLWPNLVFLMDGRVVEQLVRPADAEITSAFQGLADAAAEAAAPDRSQRPA
jgi:thioredoxin 1